MITANINVYNSTLSFLCIYLLMKPKHSAATVTTAQLFVQYKRFVSFTAVCTKSTRNKKGFYKLN